MLVNSEEAKPEKYFEPTRVRFVCQQQAKKQQIKQQLMQIRGSSERVSATVSGGETQIS